MGTGRRIGSNRASPGWFRAGFLWGGVVLVEDSWSKTKIRHDGGTGGQANMCWKVRGKHVLEGERQTVEAKDEFWDPGERRRE